MLKIRNWLVAYWQWLVGGLIIFAVVLWKFWPNSLTLTKNDPPAVQQTTMVKSTPKKSPTTIVVDVQGEVNKPGVYHLLASARIYDAIQHAGGPTANANLKGINQAQKLHDQSQVIVPDQTTATPNTNAASATATTTANASVNLNSATAEELQQVNGLGPKKAEAIIQYRQDHGSFTKVEDLTNVKGFGEKTVDNLKDQLCV